MQISIRLPDKLFYQGQAQKLYAQAENGAFGLLPKHMDFVTSLVPSVLIITAEQGEELFFGIDQGLLIKHGKEVEVAVRRAILGQDLISLAQQVQQSFMQEDEEEREARTALAKLELGMVKQLNELRKV